MKVNDFKLLTALPEEYDYELMIINDKQAVIGTLNRTIIGFFIRNNKLIPIKFMDAEGQTR